MGCLSIEPNKHQLFPLFYDQTALEMLVQYNLECLIYKLEPNSVMLESLPYVIL